ncbi:hypothetical protein QBC42DRAFT_43840 [Cladorrhinum samala]|uniref:Secreted protein n=1 Tax=Cladorrhinum samala TaxID=585594 RepID=A0AAV9HZV9_9PEZI|nr:hypothetical protein QBC42DRAFT_43840 [Cladorrhinum samala]
MLFLVVVLISTITGNQGKIRIDRSLCCCFQPKKKPVIPVPSLLSRSRGKPSKHLHTRIRAFFFFFFFPLSFCNTHHTHARTHAHTHRPLLPRKTKETHLKHTSLTKCLVLVWSGVSVHTPHGAAPKGKGDRLWGLGFFFLSLELYTPAHSLSSMLSISPWAFCTRFFPSKRSPVQEAQSSRRR